MADVFVVAGSVALPPPTFGGTEGVPAIAATGDGAEGALAPVLAEDAPGPTVSSEGDGDRYERAPDPWNTAIAAGRDPLAEGAADSRTFDWVSLGFEEAAGAAPPTPAVTGSTAVPVLGWEVPAPARLPAVPSLDALVRNGRTRLEEGSVPPEGDEGDLNARALIAEAEEPAVSGDGGGVAALIAGGEGLASVPGGGTVPQPEASTTPVQAVAQGVQATTAAPGGVSVRGTSHGPASHASGSVRGPAAAAIDAPAETLQPEVRATNQLLTVFGVPPRATVVIPRNPQPGDILTATLEQISPDLHASLSDVISGLMMLAPWPVGKVGKRVQDERIAWLEKQLEHDRVWTVGGIRASLAGLQERFHPTAHPTITRILDGDIARGYSARGPSPRRRPSEIVTLAEVSRDFVQGTRSERDLIRQVFALHARMTVTGLIQALGRLPDLAQRLREITSDGKPRVNRVGRSRNDARRDGGDDDDAQDEGQESGAD